MPSPWLCGNLAGIERTLFTLGWLRQGSVPAREGGLKQGELKNTLAKGHLLLRNKLLSRNHKGSR
jgi:hypothetical protein